jgi:hypothetical protein
MSGTLVVPRAARLAACCLLLAALLSSGGAGSEPGRSDAEGRGVIVLFNASPGRLKYETRLPGGGGALAAHVLEPGSGHIFRHSEELLCVYGSPPAETRLRPGTVYEFRKESDAVSLVSLSPQADTAAAGTADLRDRLARTTERARGLEQERDAACRREREALALLKQSAGPAIQLAGPAERVDLGPADVTDGASGVRFTVPVRHDAGKSVRVCLAAAFPPRLGHVRVEPEWVDLPPSGSIAVSLSFPNVKVAAGGEVSGQLILSGVGEHRLSRLEVPLVARFRTHLSRLPAGGDTLTVLAWPGAEVYLSEAAAPHPAAREYLGVSPVCCRGVSPGRYRVLLLPPGHSEGRWAAPAGVCGSLDVGPRAVPCLEVPVSKAEGAPALVRALWLPAAATPDGLLAASDGSPDLFPVPPFERFQVFATRALARAGVALTTTEAEKLHRVLRRCGYLRYDIGNSRGAVDFELHLDNPEAPLSCKAIQLER